MCSSDKSWNKGGTLADTIADWGKTALPRLKSTDVLSCSSGQWKVELFAKTHTVACKRVFTHFQHNS